MSPFRVRPMIVSALLGAAALATPSLAAEEVPAVLVGHAVLPAVTFLPVPSDAPEMLRTSGKYTTDDTLRDTRLYAREESSGLTLAFPGQPVQGFSGIKSLGDGDYMVLIDNGFGAKSNSADAMLMALRLHPHWDTGRVEIRETLFLHDPDGVVPFRLVTEASASRYLTGADFDPEGLQPIGDRLWFGDEFGPYILATDLRGRVVEFHETTVGGRVIRSPDHYATGTPATPGEVAFDVRRSRGFEGMAQTPDGRTLRGLLEGPLWDAEAGTWEAVDGVDTLRILEFDVATSRFTGAEWKYRLEANGHAIGDFNMISETLGLIIERDGGQGDARLACSTGADPCFEEPAVFKRVYLVDFATADDDGFVEKVAYVDLMNIQDPNGVAGEGTLDGVFTFPFVTIENVDKVDETHIIVANDNNLPFSVGRALGRADDNEFILLDVGDMLAAR